MAELEPLTILLVEDDPADQKLIKTSLKNQRVANTLHAVNSGEEGIDFLHCRGNYACGTPRPDLILLDLNMPGMGGWRCLEKLLGMDADAKVIVASGFSTEGSLEDTANAGARGFLSKPYNAREMLKTIRRVLDGD